MTSRYTERYDGYMEEKTLSAALANIELPDTEGQLIRFGLLWDTAPAVVVFLRHYG